MDRPTFSVALILSAIFSLSIWSSSMARAQDELVYWPLITNGAEYRRVSYPDAAGPVLVLADTDMIIEARYAPVSYWAITREYLADFSQELRLAAGSVEIIDEAGEITIVEPEPYVLLYPAGVGAGPSVLARGVPALELYDDYVKTARATALAIREYQRLIAEQHGAVDAWLRIAAERPEKLPKPPPELDLKEPEPYQAYATEPREAAVVSLPEGSYTVRIRDADDKIIPASERKLVSFGARKQAIGYVVRPADRWTRPIISFAPDETIYTTGQTDLYFQPVPVVEYEARRFTRLFRPQSIEAIDPNLTMWVPREEGSSLADGSSLAVSDGDAATTTLPHTAYRVAQLGNATRGYTIEEFASRSTASLKPDFHAMRVDRNLATMQISLLHGEDDVVADGSERTLQRVSLPAEPLLFLPAFLPLMIGVMLRLWMGSAAHQNRRRSKAS